MNRPKGFRKITVNNNIYFWRMGETNLVVRKDQGKSIVIGYQQLFKEYGYTLPYKSGECMDHKKYLPGIVTPKTVRDIILKRF